MPQVSTPTLIIPTKFKAPTPIRSRIMSDNVSHSLPLKMRTRALRIAESRERWVGGQLLLGYNDD